MGFEALLGNERLKENLTNSLGRGRNAHFYLISGPEGSGKHTLARLIAAAVLCRGQGRPCGYCGPCRKVMEGNHPDFITVEDPEHKTVPVKMVRQTREDIFIRPNESEHKVYLFPQELGTEGQNTLLKVLEEPPRYGVFLLLTDTPEKILPTVRSRCTQLEMQALDTKTLQNALAREFPDAAAEDIAAAAERSGGWLGQARNMLKEGSGVLPQTEQFAHALAKADALELTRVLVGMEKWKRDALCQILNDWIALTEQALSVRAGLSTPSALARTLSAGRTARELMAAVHTLKKALEYAQGNGSPGAICGWLAWELR